MTDTPLRSIQEGFRLLQQGDPEAAIPHLTFIANIRPVNDEVIEAMRLSGVAFRRLKQFDPSMRSLGDSLREARRLKKPQLEALAMEELQKTGIAVSTYGR